MKRKTHLSILFPILLLIHAIGISNAHAFVVLKCAPSTPVERFRSVDVVFTGKVIGVTNYKRFSRVKLKVLRPLKNVPTENITVFTARFVPESAHLELGKGYLVYAHMQDGRLSAGGCSYTMELKYAEEDLKQIENEINARSLTSHWSGLPIRWPLVLEVCRQPLNSGVRPLTMIELVWPYLF